MPSPTTRRRPAARRRRGGPPPARIAARRRRGWPRFGVALLSRRVRVEKEHDLAALLDDVAVRFLPLAAASRTVSPSGKRGVISASRNASHSAAETAVPSGLAVPKKSRCAARAWRRSQELPARTPTRGPSRQAQASREQWRGPWRPIPCHYSRRRRATARVAPSRRQPGPSCAPLSQIVPDEAPRTDEGRRRNATSAVHRTAGATVRTPPTTAPHRGSPQSPQSNGRPSTSRSKRSARVGALLRDARSIEAMPFCPASWQ